MPHMSSNSLGSAIKFFDSAFFFFPPKEKNKQNKTEQHTKTQLTHPLDVTIRLYHQLNQDEGEDQEGRNLCGADYEQTGVSFKGRETLKGRVHAKSILISRCPSTHKAQGWQEHIRSLHQQSCW